MPKPAAEPRIARKAGNVSIPRRCAAPSDRRCLPAALRVRVGGCFCVRSALWKPALAVGVLVRLVHLEVRFEGRDGMPEA
jgi:hypothetical protein